MNNWDLLDEDFEREFFEDRFVILIIYDIISNKRRAFLSKLLSAFGYRIQKSAFECFLTREKVEILMKKIEKFVQEDDLIRVYKLNQNIKISIYGEKMENENEDYYFI